MAAILTLIDKSGTMRNQSARVQELNTWFNARRVSNPTDTVTVLYFDEVVTEPYTNVLITLIPSFQPWQPCGRTALFDTVWDAITDRVFDVAVVVTDGMNNDPTTHTAAQMVTQWNSRTSGKVVVIFGAAVNTWTRGTK